MVPLGTQQAIIGGLGKRKGHNIEDQGNIYQVACTNRNCTITKLSQELRVPRGDFVAIPIPDDISGCT